MRSLLFVVLSIFFSGTVLYGQKPVAATTIALFKGKTPLTASLFNPPAPAKPEMRQYVDQGYSMTIQPARLQQLVDAPPSLLRLQLPAPLNIELDLFQGDVFTENSRIKTSDGLDLAINNRNLYYRGMIHGNPNSLAVVSILDDRIQIMYSDETGNKRIQQMQDGSYIAFEDKNIQVPKEMSCFVKEGLEPKEESNGAQSNSRNVSGNCVEVYVECDFKSYQDNGSSVTNTEAWVGALFNEVKTLYQNENIPIAVTDVFVYTTSDPFTDFTDTGAILNAFSAHIDTLVYNGRLAHFLSTRGLGGGIAWVDVLCSNSNPTAVSTSLSTTIIPFPTFSWSVEEVTHEMGHNFGSRHTHACVWNGNNTQIDDCGNVYATNNGQSPEGAACYNAGAPILPGNNQGSIMSYCHTISGQGISFSIGFGTQPGNVIRNRYNNASCNTGSCSVPTCTTLTDPPGGATGVDINADLNWTAVAGANGYKLTVGTTSGGTNIVNNVDVGLVTTYDPGVFPFSTTIYVKIVPYNNLGSGVNCQQQSFTTEANVAPSCTHLTSPANGASNVGLDVVIRWAHAVGNQTGYKITIGTTPTGTQIANNVNVGNVNFYDPPGLLPHSSTIYVKITPYTAAGDIPGCTAESFATVVPISGDFCSMAINLPCGATLSGNTTQALADPEAFTCGTDVSAPGIWYTFTGDGQNAIIATCTQFSFDTKLNAYSGSCSGLTCITGIDDYCNTGSLISFATTAGVNYYILVQGWDGAVGSYTLTRTCYAGPLYCPSQGNSHTSEWIQTVSLGTYTKNSLSTSYSDFTNETITVTRGASYAVTLTPGFVQGTRSEQYNVWIDLNRDGDFTDNLESVFVAGPSTAAVTGTITIPISCLNGNTRMRVSMRHNSAPPACGSYDWGEVEDYTLNVRCNLVTSLLDDTGNGTLRNVSMCADDNENILFDATLNNQTINITSGTLSVDGIWKWMPAAGSNITIKAAQNVTRLLSIPIAKSIEIQNLTLIGGTTTPGGTIDNGGALILRNTIVKPPVGSSAIPIRNSGNMSINGTSNVIH